MRNTLFMHCTYDFAFEFPCGAVRTADVVISCTCSTFCEMGFTLFSGMARLGTFSTNGKGSLTALLSVSRLEASEASSGAWKHRLHCAGFPPHIHMFRKNIYRENYDDCASVPVGMAWKELGFTALGCMMLNKLMELSVRLYVTCLFIEYQYLACTELTRYLNRD